MLKSVKQNLARIERFFAKHLKTKLMQSNRPQAKFRLKSDSNCLLIDFFDPITAALFTRRTHSIQIRTRIRLKSSILVKNGQF